MSITITTDVFSDRCSNWTHGPTSNRPKVREARKLARFDGWVCDSAGDRCPACLTHKDRYPANESEI